MKKKEFNLFCNFHLGDSVFNIHFMNKYSDTEYLFNYYINPSYHNELEKHILNKNIFLKSINDLLPKDSINMWIGHDNFFYNYIINDNNYDLFYVEFFKMFSKKLGIENRIKDKYDMLFDNSNHQIDLKQKYDFLIINSIPFSNQFNYNEDDFVNLLDFLNEKNISFITTKKVKNYKSTLDYDMSIVDIGNLSDNCSNIIGINTSPLIRTFTHNNIDKIDKRFILDKVLTYSYNDRIFNIKKFNSIYNHL